MWELQEEAAAEQAAAKAPAWRKVLAASSAALKAAAGVHNGAGSGDTETGIKSTDIVTESASLDEDENRKKILH